MSQTTTQAAELNWQRQGSAVVFSGDLDRDTLLAFWNQRKSELSGITEINVTHLNRVDSSGLAMLVHILGDAEKVGSPLSLVGVTDKLSTLITLYNLQHIIPIETERSS